MTNVAELGIRIFLDDTAAAGLNNINGLLGILGQMLGYVGYAWSQLPPEIQLAAEVAAGAGLDFMAFSDALKQTIQDAAQLQDTMARVQIAFDANDSQMQAMTTELERVASQSRFSTDQIGQGFVMLGERVLGLLFIKSLLSSLLKSLAWIEFMKIFQTAPQKITASLSP